MNLWEQLDAQVRPFVQKALKELGWTLMLSGNNQWVAERDSTGIEIAKMNPTELVKAVEAHERHVEEEQQKRARGMF